ncbi:MAG: glycoside hydrolase 43 family protein [Clostridia bacterium]|nr:glycoside hydrolase 43 family protein [Clostridia bacterium]
MSNNPILKMDFPDPDVIFHDGFYYMATTTMHFFPGGEILRSKDLVNWEHYTYVYDKLESTPAQRLEEDQHIYGKGMWAPCIRYNNGTFHYLFSSNDMQKTYLYRSSHLKGPWKRSEIEGFYHDSSLLFDEGKTYIVYGNREIHLTELNDDISAPREGGLDRIIVNDVDNKMLGYEGSHIYKIDGRYWVFFIHSLKDRWRRVEAAFSSDSLEGEFVGGDVFDEDLGIRDSGIAQGGIVQGPDGKWHAVLFQDSGAIGRVPVVVPVTWEDGKPVFTGKLDLGIKEEPCTLYGSDNFEKDFRDFWQFNHEPDDSLIKFDNGFHITTDKVSPNIFHAKNTLTQRMTAPLSEAEVTIDAKDINDGDVACLSAFIGDFALVGITKRDGDLYAVMMSNVSEGSIWDLSEDTIKTEELIKLSNDRLTVRISCDFTEDTATCYVKLNGEFKKIGEPHKMRFRLDHFTGVRFALSYYSTVQTGGTAVFTDYIRN